jgi:hypothetical protein
MAVSWPWGRGPAPPPPAAAAPAGGGGGGAGAPPTAMKLPSVGSNGTQRFIITVFTRALSQIDRVHTTPSYLSKIHLNIIHLPTSWSSWWSLSFWLSHRNTICIPLCLQSCYMSCLSHPPRLGHSDYTWRRAQVMKLLIMQFPPTSTHLISLRSSMPETKFHTRTKSQAKIIVL